MKKRRFWVAAAAVAALGFAAPISAQRHPGARMQQRQQLEHRVRQRMGQMIRRELGLSEEQQKALGDVMSQFQEQRQDLARREGQIRYQATGLATGKLEMTEAEQRELLARSADLREEEAQLFKAEQERLLEVLTPMQLLKFNALRERFGEQIRRLRSGQGPAGRRRPRRPGGIGEPGWIGGSGRPGTLPPRSGLF